MPKPSDDDLTVKRYEAHYFGDSKAEDIGERTLMVRKAYARVKKKQRRVYLGIITVVFCLFLAAGGYAVLKHLEVKKHRQLAQDIFYSMKSLELDLSEVLKAVRITQDAQLKKNVEAYQARLIEMEEQYDRFIRSLHVYEGAVDEKDRIILKMARVFGECEINMPEGFREEVLNYVARWKSTDRLESGIKRAQANGYISKTMEVMRDHDLPVQLFYLGLQESNFDVNACGPETGSASPRGRGSSFLPRRGSMV